MVFKSQIFHLFIKSLSEQNQHFSLKAHYYTSCKTRYTTHDSYKIYKITDI